MQGKEVCKQEDNTDCEEVCEEVEEEQCEGDCTPTTDDCPEVTEDVCTDVEEEVCEPKDVEECTTVDEDVCETVGYWICSTHTLDWDLKWATATNAVGIYEVVIKAGLGILYPVIPVDLPKIGPDRSFKSNKQTFHLPFISSLTFVSHL